METNRKLRTQPCPVCQSPMGDMPGSRDAYCPSCGYKDPCSANNLL